MALNSTETIKIVNQLVDDAKLIDDEVFKLDEEVCRLDAGQHIISDNGFKLLAGQALNLYAVMMHDGVATEERTRIVRYCKVIFNMQKHRLDHKKAKKYFGFKELNNKYSPWKRLN